jgi:hypothetical protein
MRLTAFPIRLLAVTCLMSVFAAVPAAGQKKESKGSGSGGAATAELAATVFTYPSQGTVTCADLNLDDARFNSITEDYEFKIDPPPPVGTSAHPIVEGGGGNLGGGLQPDDGTLTVNLSSDKEVTSFSFANGPTDPYYAISAVIVKGGNRGTNVYYYPNLTLSDSGSFTVTGGRNAISHLSFCLQPTIRPSAADGSVSGSVTNRFGGAIANARVRLTSLATGAVQTVYTNSFGYYRFDALETGDAYNVSVYASGYTFATSSSTFTLMGDQTVNFVAK